MLPGAPGEAAGGGTGSGRLAALGPDRGGRTDGELDDSEDMYLGEQDWHMLVKGGIDFHDGEAARRVGARERGEK